MALIRSRKSLRLADVGLGHRTHARITSHGSGLFGQNQLAVACLAQPVLFIAMLDHYLAPAGRKQDLARYRRGRLQRWSRSLRLVGYRLDGRHNIVRVTNENDSHYILDPGLGKPSPGAVVTGNHDCIRATSRAVCCSLTRCPRNRGRTRSCQSVVSVFAAGLGSFLLFTEPESRLCKFWQLPINAEGRGIGKAVNGKPGSDQNGTYLRKNTVRTERSRQRAVEVHAKVQQNLSAPFMLRQACPERSRRAQHERKRVSGHFRA